MRASILLLLAAALAAGCASEVKRQPAELSTAANAGQRQSTTTTVEARLESGYARTIRPDTEFVVLGRIAQGTVLKPTQTVLTVEGAHMHEAYAVHRDGALVGFYLPVERAYTALPTPVPMPLQEKR